MKVFVPGGTGFLGTHVTTMLTERGHRVVTAGRSPRADVYLDVTSISAEDLRRSLKDIDPEVTINLVGNGLSDSAVTRSELSAVNSVWPATLAQALKDSTGSSLIHAASSTELLTDENGNFESAYSRSRAEGTQKLQAVERETSMPITVAYVHNTFGPDQPPRRLVKWVVSNMLDKRPFSLAYPDRVRDFIYVHDAAESLSQLAEDRQAPQHVHVGTGRGTSLKALAQMVADLADSDPTLMTEGTPDQDPYAVNIADPDLLQRSATISLQDGLLRVISAVQKGVDS